MTSWEVRRAQDHRLFSSIKDGVKGTAMPAFPLPDDQVWQLVAFIRSLNAPARSLPVSGNPEAGAVIFTGKGGCSACHMIRGEGGYLGPDLSDIGATRRLSELRNAIVNPKPTASPGYLPVLLSTAHGQQLRGVAKHYSLWSMQVIDEKGGIHLLHDSQTKTATIQNRSWMPDDIANRLSAQELDDLIAYLSRQAIRPESKSEPQMRRAQRGIN